MSKGKSGVAPDVAMMRTQAHCIPGGLVCMTNYPITKTPNGLLPS
jgi:hypothetical protein